ncbi:MauE/DoxX family redox-associated membrane protein [Nakamurella lactea]|uniref:MauE/DoxX family redox-associated membrane protein n=1 Tax=Nakamurella lactea TaxID=459515 RepID=UPI00042120AC|nr:MauE/DoxX family redox-associated membrane protein [Nakamurella lactea]
MALRGRTDLNRLLDWIGLVVRLGLAAVWLASGIAKASNSRETIVAVRAYRILPESAVRPVAGVLPYLEIALGVLLLLGLATRLAAVLSSVVLAVFIAGVISAAARGLSIDCGCFGGGGDVAAGNTQYTAEILRDVGFLVMAGFLIWRPWTALSIDGFVASRNRVTEDEQA